MVKIDKKIVGYSVKQQGQESDKATFDAQSKDEITVPAHVPVQVQSDETEIMNSFSWSIKRNAEKVNNGKMIHDFDKVYITLVFDGNNNPVQVFFNSKDFSINEHLSMGAISLSHAFKNGTYLELLESMIDIVGEGFFHRKKYRASLISAICSDILYYLGRINARPTDITEQEAAPKKQGAEPKKGEKCQRCGEYAVVVLDGCKTCLDCGDSKCG